MRKADSIQRPITAKMIKEARAQQDWFHNCYKNNSTTRAVSEDRDIIGDLAHQVVENFLDEVAIPYHSERLIRHESGDELDLLVRGEKWDVKGTMLPDYEFYVFDKQMRNPKVDELDQFCFVQISRDMKVGKIYSLCPVPYFKKKMKIAPRGGINGFKYNNQGVLTLFLPSFKDWFMKQPATVDRAMAAEKIRLDKADYNHYNTSMLNHKADLAAQRGVSSPR